MILICVITNMIILTLDRINISASEENMVLIMNKIFYAIYCLEMLVKLLALGIS